MASKRGLPSPSGKTPVRPTKRLNDTENSPSLDKTRRPLYIPSNSWTDKEDESLTTFILISNIANNEWPSTKSPKLWDGAATFIRNMCRTTRTSGSCRTRVNRDLKKRFKTPKIAEDYYSSLLISPSESADNHSSGSYFQNQHNSPPSSAVSVTIETVDSLAQLLNNLCQLDPEQHLVSLSEGFAAYCSRMAVPVPSDFIPLAFKAMQNLQFAKRSNILYYLAKGLGTPTSNGDDSLFPTKGILTGLI
jgi:hypothetical protein